MSSQIVLIVHPPLAPISPGRGYWYVHQSNIMMEAWGGPQDPYASTRAKPNRGLIPTSRVDPESDFMKVPIQPNIEDKLWRHWLSQVFLKVNIDHASKDHENAMPPVRQ